MRFKIIEQWVERSILQERTPTKRPFHGARKFNGEWFIEVATLEGLITYIRKHNLVLDVEDDPVLLYMIGDGKHGKITSGSDRKPHQTFKSSREGSE